MSQFRTYRHADTGAVGDFTPSLAEEFPALIEIAAERPVCTLDGACGACDAVCELAVQPEADVAAPIEQAEPEPAGTEE